MNVITDKAKALVARVLQDPENDLADILRAFQDSDDSVWHIDRHVLNVDEGFAAEFEARLGACAAGLGLMRRWGWVVSAKSASDLIVSTPYLVIDDEWLEGRRHAPSPHVYICLSKGEEGLAVEHEADHGTSMTLPSPVADLLMEGEAFYRISGPFDDQPGAWLIRIETPAAA
jgi:hypothetical protein